MTTKNAYHKDKLKSGWKLVLGFFVLGVLAEMCFDAVARNGEGFGGNFCSRNVCVESNLYRHLIVIMSYKH